MTNEERIKNMDKEELVKFLLSFKDDFYNHKHKGLCEIDDCSDENYSCTKCVYTWLEKEVK